MHCVATILTDGELRLDIFPDYWIRMLQLPRMHQIVEAGR